jgi:SAM-dependent methyltransferase
MVDGVPDQSTVRQSEPEAVRPSSASRSTPGFDNRRFWEERYTTNPELGSGAGSRGEFLDYKKELLSRLIATFDVRSILDVGCGDIKVVKDLDFTGEYTGIDISPTIIVRNRKLCPTWTFIEGDFLEVVRHERPVADLVIGYSVLIHQHDYNAYREFARELVDAARVVALLNGVESLPRGGRISANAAYHEPLTQTLKDIERGSLTVIGPLRNTLVVQVEKATSTET